MAIVLTARIAVVLGLVFAQASVDLNDVPKTLAFVKSLSGPLEKAIARKNQAAIDLDREELSKTIEKAFKGQTVTWKIQVLDIRDDAILFKRLPEYAPKTGPRLIPGFGGWKGSKTARGGDRAIPIIDRKWAASVDVGQIIAIKGVVRFASVNAALDVSVFLDDCEITK